MEAEDGDGARVWSCRARCCCCVSAVVSFTKRSSWLQRIQFRSTLVAAGEETAEKSSVAVHSSAVSSHAGPGTLRAAYVTAARRDRIALAAAAHRASVSCAVVSAATSTWEADFRAASRSRAANRAERAACAVRRMFATSAGGGNAPEVEVEAPPRAVPPLGVAGELPLLPPPPRAPNRNDGSIALSAEATPLNLRGGGGSTDALLLLRVEASSAT